MKALLWCLAAFASAEAAVPAAAQDGLPDVMPQVEALAQGDSAAADERLRKLFDLYWTWQMTRHPEYATYVGYPGQNERWADDSAAAIERRQRETRQFLEVAQAFDRAQLSDADRLNLDLFTRELDREVQGFRFGGEVMPITQMGGVQQAAPQVLAAMPAETTADYEAILARLRSLPALIDQQIALLQRGAEKGVTPPQVILRDVPEQVENLLAQEPMDSPVLRAFAQLPEDMPEAEQQRLRAEAVAAYEEVVAPAFEKLRAYLADEYLPAARETVALSALPEGEAWYAHRAASYTTTDLTPQEIHEIGRREVERIRGEMEAVIDSAGFDGGLEAFVEFLRTDPQFFYDTPEALLKGYRDISKRADPELVKLFGTLPRLPYGVEAVPAYAEKSQTTAYYMRGSREANRPGTYYANTYDLGSRPKWEMEALTLHEAVPGHHLQIALAQELEDVPQFRRQGGYTAFVEGWGLYAESLGEEMGFYQDPYSKFGQLTYEMWRAVRLVVDTGMHALGWSRQQAIDYFAENAAKTKHDITVEIDRYIAWPGQALAYKIGELKIKELRAYAEDELGEAFNIRAFHDEVLSEGALPLDILEQRVKAWVAAQKADAQQASR